MRHNETNGPLYDALALLALILFLVLFYDVAYGATYKAKVYEEMIVVQNRDVLVAASLDGWVCYGTKDPAYIPCHRAVPTPTYKEIK